MDKQLSKEWFESRKDRITGSIAGACLGLSPFMTTADVMRSMVRSSHGAKSEFTGNIATEYGNRNEPNAIIDFELETGLKVTEIGFYKYESWLGASPDGIIVSENAALEIKCPFGLRNKADPEFKSSVDLPHYYAQMQIEMICTNTHKCYFYQWSPYGSRLEIIERDDVYVHDMLMKLRAFYSLFLTENRYNYEIHLREKTESTIELGDKEIKALCEYKETKQALEHAKVYFDIAKNNLIEIAESTGQDKVLLDDVNLTKVKRSGSIAYAKMVKDMLPNAPTDKYKGADTEYWKVG